MHRFNPNEYMFIDSEGEECLQLSKRGINETDPQDYPKMLLYCVNKGAQFGDKVGHDFMQAAISQLKKLLGFSYDTPNDTVRDYLIEQGHSPA